jgi:hypothetical protein
MFPAPTRAIFLRAINSPAPTTSRQSDSKVSDVFFY